MRIERINDSTIKLYITYQDIEQRGFKKEDLWSSRKKGEEFFWTLMDEVGSEEKADFNFEGPLWIQVHASEKGVEVVVSRTSDDHMSDMLPPGGTVTGLGIDDSDIEDFLNDDFGANPFKPSISVAEEPLVIEFENFDDLIRYSYQVDLDETLYEDLLFFHDGKYYYQVHFDSSITFDEADGFEARLLEFGAPTTISDAVLQEYGKVIMSNNVRRQIRNYFKSIS